MFIPKSCYYCGTDGKMLEVKAHIKNSKGETVSNDIPAFECQECGKQTFTHDSYEAAIEAFKVLNTITV